MGSEQCVRAVSAKGIGHHGFATIETGQVITVRQTASLTRLQRQAPFKTYPGLEDSPWATEIPALRG
jgi:hypothetical protein